MEAILLANVPKEELESVCTEHAIEVGAEDVEIMDEGSKLVRVRCYLLSSTYDLFHASFSVSV